MAAFGLSKKEAIFFIRLLHKALTFPPVEDPDTLHEAYCINEVVTTLFSHKLGSQHHGS